MPSKSRGAAYSRMGRSSSRYPSALQQDSNIEAQASSDMARHSLQHFVAWMPVSVTFSMLWACKAPHPPSTQPLCIELSATTTSISPCYINRMLAIRDSNQGAGCFVMVQPYFSDVGGHGAISGHRRIEIASCEATQQWFSRCFEPLWWHRTSGLLLQALRLRPSLFHALGLRPRG